MIRTASHLDPTVPVVPMVLRSGSHPPAERRAGRFGSRHSAIMDDGYTDLTPGSSHA